MYAAEADPYCYAGTNLLKNIPGIQDQDALNAFEAISTTQRSDEPLPHGKFSVTQYRAIHHHLFQDVYHWAGSFRTVRISKDKSTFCYPEHIDREMKSLFADLRRGTFLSNLSQEEFAANAAHFLGMLNAIHPFREGNGRTQMSFFALLSNHAGYSLHLEKLVPGSFLAAMISSFEGDEVPLSKEILRLIV